MLKKWMWWLGAGMCALVGSVAGAAGDAAPTQEQQAADMRQITTHLEGKLPQLSVVDISPTPVTGIYQLELEDAQLVYTTADGRYLFSGDMFEIGDQLINLAEANRVVKRKGLLDRVPMEEMVVFSPAGETRDYVHVFTDVDCGYCRKLHLEVPELNAKGIEVRYLAYPRAGMGTPAFHKIVSAWCAKNPEEALTAVKAGQVIPNSQCDHPVADQFDLGRKVGVTGTPAIVTSDGRMLPGYMPADELISQLGIGAR